MPRRNFPCGHQGKGQFCHRCKQAAQAQESKQQQQERELAQKQQDRQAWDATLAADPIDLTPLQTRERITKARELLRRLAAGEPYTSLGGKRWESDRSIVSLPVGHKHRLVLRDEGGQLRPLACMTHEAYNNLRPDALA